MSKYFELTQQAGLELATDPKLGPSPVLAGDVTRNGRKNRARLDIAEMAHEELLKLVQRVFSSNGAECPHAVAFAGIESGDGCSWICSEAAKTLARSISGSVCLVEANLRSPSLQRVFGITKIHGLADALQQKGAIREFMHQLCPDNLWLLLGGASKSDSGNLLKSDRLQARLLELRKEFDYVLISAPPVIADGTATMLGPLVDGVILVVEANATHREVARKAKKSLESANVRLLGAVLNNRTFPIPGAIYSRL